MATASNNPPLLEVKNLRVEFPTRRGTLLAVDASDQADYQRFAQTLATARNAGFEDLAIR